jgi:hypothetical protein
MLAMIWDRHNGRTHDCGLLRAKEVEEGKTRRDASEVLDPTCLVSACQDFIRSPCSKFSDST